MKVPMKHTIPFIALALLPIFSLFISCLISGDLLRDQISFINMDADKNSDGKLYTPEYFQSIDRISIISMTTRTRKKKLSPEQWRYHPETAELELFETLQPDEILHIEGERNDPRMLKLRDYAIEDDALSLIVGDRLAEEGTDYYINKEENALVFGKTLSESHQHFMLSFLRRDGGMTSYGDLPFNDSTAYIRALGSARIMNHQQISYEIRKNGEGEPEIIKRTNRDALEQTDYMVICRERTQATVFQLSQEVGFDIAVPKQLSRRYHLTNKMITETASGKTVTIFYTNKNEYRESIMVEIMSAHAAYIEELFDSKKDQEEASLVIERREFSLHGIKVVRLQLYSIDQTIPDRPELCTVDLYCWIQGTAAFVIQSQYSDPDQRIQYEQYIETLITYRK